MPDPRELPIYEIQAALLDGARATGRVVVQAPTGSGKSTQVPKMLLAAGLLERGQWCSSSSRGGSRRACSPSAWRRSWACGWGRGGLPGAARIRACPDKTRIRYVTEGICCGR
jgi:ATP-dependent helicase HrpB